MGTTVVFRSISLVPSFLERLKLLWVERVDRVWELIQ